MDISAYDIVVAKDGSGNFTTIQEALDSIRVNNQSRVKVFVKDGVYEEKVLVDRYTNMISLIGQSCEGTIIRNGDGAGMIAPDGKKFGTFRTHSLLVLGDDFIAENITIENSASKDFGQAVALEVSADRAAFINCRLLGWQDTLLAGKGRQYYCKCYIEGHCDFIFGSAAAVFENCSIYCKAGGYITAASTLKDQKYGFVFINCDISGYDETKKTFLGRPWRPYSHTVFLNCSMSQHIRPEGWDNWRDPEKEKTSRYGEYNSKGPGAAHESRVKWAKQLTAEEAAEYTVENVLGYPDGWNPKLDK